MERLLAANGAAHEPNELLQFGRHHVAFIQLKTGITDLGQLLGAQWVGPQENAIASVSVHNDQCAVGLGNPKLRQIVGRDRVFLAVVENQVAMGAEEMRAAPLIGQYVTIEEFDLQAKVNERFIQTELAKLVANAAGGAQGVEPRRALFAAGYGQFQPLIRFINGKAVERGLVQIVQHLADDAAALNADAIKIGLSNGAVHKARHVILAGLQVEKGRFARRVAKFGGGSQQGPVERERVARQPSQRGNVHWRPRRRPWPAQRVVIGLGQRALRHQHQNLVAARALLAQQPLNALDGQRGLAGAKRAGQIEFGVALNVI